MRNHGKVLRIAGVMLGVGVVASCGSTAMDVAADAMGDAVVDAGGALVDAGEWLMDGGEVVRDAADDAVSDAEAQPGCATSCSAMGVQRVMTAETDLAQLVHGTAQASDLLTDSGGLSSRYAELASGPLVVTYARHVQTGATFYVSDTGSCDVDPTYLNAHRVGWTADIATGSLPALTGNVPIQAGERFCAMASGSYFVTWNGFRPYE